MAYTDSSFGNRPGRVSGPGVGFGLGGIAVVVCRVAGMRPPSPSAKGGESYREFRLTLPCPTDTLENMP